MNDKKKFLKKIVAFDKKHKVPLNLIVIEITVLLFVYYLGRALATLIKSVACKLWNIITFPFVKLYKGIRRFKRPLTVMVSVLIMISIIVGLGFTRYKSNNVKNSGTHLAMNDNTEYKSEIDNNLSTLDKIQTGIADDSELTNTEETSSTEVVTTKQEDIISTTKDTTETEENTFTIEGKLPYLIKINRALNCITVYTYNEAGEYTVPYKAIICSTGGTKTPTGTYNLSTKVKFGRLLFDAYGQYCTRIVGQILFHSSTYTANNKDTLLAEDYNQLGEGVSHGCIRLTVKDAKWIYENCDAGTIVTIYDDYNSPGPLGKPQAIKLPLDSLWDPTDEAENNPWNSKNPEIIGVSDYTIHIGDNTDLLNGVTAIDTCGNDITDDIEINGSVNNNVTGTYSITYSVTDLLGRTAETKITVKVVK